VYLSVNLAVWPNGHAGLCRRDGALYARSHSNNWCCGSVVLLARRFAAHRVHPTYFLGAQFIHLLLACCGTGSLL
jgi:hypothetical protein